MSDDPHHIFELFDPSKFVQAFELQGRDHTVTIARVRGETVEGEEGRKSKKPVIDLEEWPRPLVLNKTNARVLIRFYGADYRAWSGKRFTMFPTEVKFGKEMVDAIRIRNTKPQMDRAQKVVRTIPERIEAFRKMLSECTTEASVSALVGKASGLFTDVDDATGATLRGECAEKAERLRGGKSNGND